MKPALLLVDLQRDFFDRAGLFPRAAALVREVQTLLGACRELHVPVVHIHTQVRRDGCDRMPHWKRDNTWACVEGSTGVMPPDALRARDHELVLFKQHWSSFSNDRLEATLRKQQIDTLIVAGLYLEGCVRAAAVDAYQCGFEVWIAEDAVGSADCGQAEMARIYLEGRAAAFLDTPQILSRLGMSSAGTNEQAVPAANIAGNWLPADSHRLVERRNPSNWSEVLASVPVGTRSDVDRAGGAAMVAQSAWRRTSPSERAAVLGHWAEILTSRAEALANLLARDWQAVDGRTG